MTYTYRGTQPERTAKKPGPKSKPRDPSLCGTKLGYKQHVRFREESCRPCLDAYNQYQREMRAARRAS